MPGYIHRHVKSTALVALMVAALAGWGVLFYLQKQESDPEVIVRKHFLFYSEYSHGVWHEAKCPADREYCYDVTYTVPVKGCGAVTFDWQVFRGDDAGDSWAYKGTRPSFDESKYPLYAMLSPDSHFIDSPALGKPVPDTCQLK